MLGAAAADAECGLPSFSGRSPGSKRQTRAAGSRTFHRAVLALCAKLGLDRRRAAVIGDMMNDVPMFQVAGFAIAMGQAPDAVRAAADDVTTSNGDEGFAHAVAQFILPRRPALPVAS